MTQSRRSTSPLSAVVALLIAILGLLAPPRACGAFGLSDEGKSLVVDSGAGLVFKVNKANGDIVSIRYKGSAELQESKKGSHIASGLGSTTKVSGAVIGGNTVRITLATDEASGAVKNLTHYLIVRNGLNNIYLATYATAEPGVGELRWITRLEAGRFPNSPKPANNREASKTIESQDVFGGEDGTTRSKYYGDAQTHGKDRAMDLTFCGVSGQGVGVWMVYGTRESSSGGPFHRDIQNQSAEVYNYMNSGHNMTEPPRLNVLHGPYALVFTDGQPPMSLDFSWIDTARLDLAGYVPATQRGAVAGLASGVPAGLRGVVGFSNASAQYWVPVGADGTYLSPPMKPGSYDVKLYQGELAVGSGKVSVQAGAKARFDLNATPVPQALFRIGEWDGAPAGFLNGDKIGAMHPSDARMSAWGPVTFTVGVDPAAKFPALQLRKVNSPTTIKFNLTKVQIAERWLRIGITCAYDGARPDIRMNAWKPQKPSEATAQPRSRSFTIGTYRGNNAVFTYRIPASAFVIGENTLIVTPLSGSSDLSSWLSAGWAYDAIQLDALPAH